ncbi:FadR/GntR family transcriptional regulator [Desulfofundulus salinus]|uniref:FadR family transcriptional regulator n=1 Tax=Desulfofundulus salinus TaxID=2419843 RepID=A0A494WRH9_9FIRM|nr:FadR/GntR family transcriptional regulator [Desulfofundulus salinum]RKO65838.1 FadR family transcriptional regulator [Desulfofundulus salinum]
MIGRRKAWELIVEELRAMIRQGRFKPGDRLPSEAELAKMFGVSRSPIREALSVLEAAGIIASRQGGGSYVRAMSGPSLLESVILEAMDYKQALHLLEVRQILETEAAALASERRDEEDLAAMEEALLKFKLVTEDEGAIGDEEDFAFHRAVVVAAHNPVLIRIVDDISDLYRKCLSVTLAKNVGFRRKREQVFKEHAAIFEAIKEMQTNLARVQASVHLEKVKEKVKKLLESLEKNKGARIQD